MSCTASERLKETLEQWKSLWYMYELSMRYSLRGDPAATARMLAQTPPWRSFEKLVLDNGIKNLDHEAYIPTPQMIKCVPRLEQFQFFPSELFDWNRESRRVYVLPKELQYELIRGTYPNLRWKDLRWPMDSFVLSLGEPLNAEDAEGVWVRYDTIFVSRTDAGAHQAVSMRIMREPVNSDGGNTFRKDAAHAEKCLLRGDYERGFALLVRAIRKWESNVRSVQGWRDISLFNSAISGAGAKVRILPEHFLEQYLKYPEIAVGRCEDEVREHAERTSIMAKMVVGTCLYLASLPSAAAPRTKKGTDKGNRGVTGIITSADRICDVLAKGVIDPVAFGIHEPHARTSAMFVRPHWRRGHWRRPPGSPSTVPKSIWVPRVLVRKDLVPPHGLISGTETTIKPEE